MHEPTLIDIHLRRSFLLLRPRVRRLRLTLRCLCPRGPGHSASPPWHGLGLGQDRNHEVKNFLLLDDDVRHLEHRNLILGPLGLPRI